MPAKSFEDIKKMHRQKQQEPLPPDSDLKEAFERNNKEVQEIVSLLSDDVKRTDAEIKTIKENGLVDYKRSMDDIRTKMQAQIDESKKEFAEKLEEYKRSLGDLQGKDKNAALRDGLRSFLRNNEIPEQFQRSTQTNNPQNAGFAINLTTLLGMRKEEVPLSSLSDLVSREVVSTPSGQLSLMKGLQISKNKGTFLNEGEQISEVVNFEMEQISFETQGLPIQFTLTVPYLQTAQNPEEQLILRAAEEMQAISNMRILFGNNRSNGPTGIIPELSLVDNQSKYKAYNSATANTVVLRDLRKLWGHKAIGAYRRNAKWFMSTDVLADLRFEEGNNGQFKWTTDIREGIPLQLSGQPVVEVFEMDDVGTGNYPVLYGDISKAYVLVETDYSHMTRDNLSKMSFDQVVFIFMRYMDGKPVDTKSLVGLRVA